MDPVRLSWMMTNGRTGHVHTAGTHRHITRANTSEGHSMSIIGWIILGLVAGFIASKIVNAQGQGLLLDIALGVVGAIVGGFLFSLFGAEGVTGVNLYSMLVAIAGSVVVLWIYHMITGRRTV
jgi:uncharacterized membrane protein YeaQ/YmgE (transglycosylase-associated protein family)